MRTKTIIGQLTAACLGLCLTVATPHAAAATTSYTFSSSDEGFTKQNPQPLSDIGWDPGNQRIALVGDRRDPGDELYTHALSAQATTSSNFTLTSRWATTAQGNWHEAQPIFLAANGVTDLNADANAIYVHYVSRDIWHPQQEPPQYFLRYRDASGVLRINRYLNATANTEYRFYVNYASDTHLLTMKIRDSADVELLTESYTTGTSPNDGFTLDKVGVATDGTLGSNEPTMSAWIDDITWTDTMTPVAPAITSGPANPTNSTTASFGFTGEAGATFQCRIDGGLYASCTSPKTYSGLLAGSHTFDVRQTNTGGVTSAPATVPWVIDTTAPGAPAITSGPASPTNSTTGSFSFTGESGATFQCALDGGSFASCTSPRTYSGLGGGSHTVQVRQIDPAGNVSPPASYTWTIDVTAPGAPAITGGPAGATTSTSASFSFTGESGATFQCALDGGAFASCTSPKTYSGVPDGSHSFQVRQTDTASNAGPPATYSWTVDTGLPTTPLVTGAPASPTNSTTATFSFVGESGATFQCQLDGSGFSPCGSPKTYFGLGHGDHTFQVRQLDAAGNTSAAASVLWTIDLVAPAAPSITTKPANPTTATSATFGFTGETGGSYQCRLDGTTFVACTSPMTYSGLSDGSHTFEVRQHDAAGNIGATASYGWVVDTVPPAAPVVTSYPASPTNARTASFGFTGEPSASFACRLDAGTFASCGSPKAYAGLAAGSHTFQVRQSDLAGQTSPAATYTWSINAQCGDGVDNDGDARVDYPSDPGCAGPDDDLEGPSCNPIAPDVVACLDSTGEVTRLTARAPTATPDEVHHVVGYVDVYTFAVPNGPAVSLPCVVLLADTTTADPCALAGGVRGARLLELLDEDVTTQAVAVDGPELTSVGLCNAELTVTVKGIGIQGAAAYAIC